MEIGDRIIVKAVCGTHYETKDRYSNGKKILSRQEPNKPIDAVFIGYSYRETGYYNPSGEYWDDYSGQSYGQAHLTVDKRYKVAMFVPVPESGARYLKPMCALPEDIELINGD